MTLSSDRSRHLAALNFNALSVQLEALPLSALKDIANALSAKLIKLPLNLLLCERVAASSTNASDVVVYTCCLDKNFDLAATAKRALELERCHHDETSLHASNSIGDSHD